MQMPGSEDLVEVIVHEAIKDFHRRDAFVLRVGDTVRVYLHTSKYITSTVYVSLA